MRASRASATAAATLLALGLGVGSAQAQTPDPTQGFALDRFIVAEPDSEFFAADSLDFRGHLRPSGSITIDYARRPLVLFDPATEADVAATVSDQAILHLATSLTVIDRLRFGLSFPIGLTTAGEGAVLNGRGYQVNEGAGAGDLRLSAHVLLAGRPGSLARGSLGVTLFTPTGRRSGMFGDGRVRILPAATYAGDWELLTWSFAFGVHGRFPDADYGEQEDGTELINRSAVGVRLLDDQLLVGPEMLVGTVVTGGAFGSRAGSNVELILGGHYQIPSDPLPEGLFVSAGVSPGITPAGYGTPDVRVLAQISYRHPIDPQRDRDGDGIVDTRDVCPDKAGTKNDDPDYFGCPDGDGDGKADAVDSCPDIAGDDENGCPAPVVREDIEDADGDGIDDAFDACPNVAGVKSDRLELTGCPEDGDFDADDIPNVDDACPFEAGPAKKKGCPVARIRGDRIEIEGRVEFGTGSATIRQTSYEVLEAVHELLEDWPTIKRVRVVGHTDDVGNAAVNQHLSQKRAEAVVAWLVARGIAPSRLAAEGKGESEPIVDNSTAENRQINRRVDFIIEE